MSKLKVLMVDPSLFTYPHDSRLARAMNELCDVEIVGRPLRSNEKEKVLDPYPVTDLFYRFSEWLRTHRRFRVLIPYVKAIDHIYGMMLLIRYVKEQRPNVIHFQWMPIPYVDKFIVRRLRRTCLVYFTVHDLTPFNGNPSSRFQSLGFVDSLAAFDGLIVHTKATFEYLMARGSTSRKLCVVGIPPDIDAQGVLCNCDANGAVSRGTEKLKVLIVGLLKQYKGIDIAIRAIGLLPEDVANRVSLIIAGDPKMPMQPLFELQNMLPKPDVVEWRLGFLSTPDMCSVLGDADIVLFPYRGIEGSGIFSQALIFEKPVVATNFGIFAETICQYGCGLLAEPNPSDISSKLTQLIRDRGLYDRCKGGAKQAGAALPTWRGLAERIVAFYDQA